MYFAAWAITEGKTFPTHKLAQVLDTSPDFFSIHSMARGQILDGWRAYSVTRSLGRKQFDPAQLTAVSTHRFWHRCNGDATLSSVPISANAPDGSTPDIPANITPVHRNARGQWRIVHKSTCIPMPK